MSAPVRTSTMGPQTRVSCDGYVFLGPSQPDYPGPVFMMMPGWRGQPVHVSSPERFGATFGPAWVATFLARSS